MSGLTAPVADEVAGALDTTSSNPFGYATWIPITAMVIYIWGGWIVTQNVGYNETITSSIFVTSAEKYSPAMASALTILLILNVASTSSTALYVASRTLFGVAYTTTKIHEDDMNPDRLLKIMALLSRKSKFDVPWVAVLVSSFLGWLPFFKYWLASPSGYLAVSSHYLHSINDCTALSDHRFNQKGRRLNI